MQNFTFFVKYVIIRVVTYSMFLLIAEREIMKEKIKWAFKKFFLEVLTLGASILSIFLFFNAWIHGHFIIAVILIFSMFSFISGFVCIRGNYKFDENTHY